jgi:hypothetical protein
MGSRFFVTLRKYWIPAPVPDLDPGFAGMKKKRALGTFYEAVKR